MELSEILAATSDAPQPEAPNRFFEQRRFYRNSYSAASFSNNLDAIGAKVQRFLQDRFGQDIALAKTAGGAEMPQEVSISYQAVKSKVYKLIDAMVEGEKTAIEVQESMQRWWGLIHPADRAVAQKYLLMVLEKSNATLGAIILGLPARDSKALRAIESERLPKLPTRTDRAVFSQPM